MTKPTIGYALFKEPDGNEFLLVGFGRKLCRIDEGGCIELEILKSSDFSFTEVEDESSESLDG